jgi:hypothetical protein
MSADMQHTVVIKQPERDVQFCLLKSILAYSGRSTSSSDAVHKAEMAKSISLGLTLQHKPTPSGYNR